LWVPPFRQFSAPFYNLLPCSVPRPTMTTGSLGRWAFISTPPHPKAFSLFGPSRPFFSPNFNLWGSPPPIVFFHQKGGSVPRTPNPFFGSKGQKPGLFNVLPRPSAVTPPNLVPPLPGPIVFFSAPRRGYNCPRSSPPLQKAGSPPPSPMGKIPQYNPSKNSVPNLPTRLRPTNPPPPKFRQEQKPDFRSSDPSRHLFPPRPFRNPGAFVFLSSVLLPPRNLPILQFDSADVFFRITVCPHTSFSPRPKTTPNCCVLSPCTLTFSTQ